MDCEQAYQIPSFYTEIDHSQLEISFDFPSID